MSLLDILEQNKINRLISGADRPPEEFDVEEFEISKEIHKDDRELERLDEADEVIDEAMEPNEEEFEQIQEEVQDVFNYEMHNIADLFPEHVITTIVGKIFDEVERDIKSKDKWRDIIEKAKDCFDFDVVDKDPSKDSSSIPGNVTGYKQLSSDKSFVLNKALISTSAIIDSKFLSNNMVRFIVDDEEKEEAAQELAKYFNWYLTQAQRDYISDKRRSFNYLEFDGVVFWKTYFDQESKLVKSKYISGREIDVDAMATSLEENTRVSYKFFLSQSELDYNKATGKYRDINYVRDGYDDNEQDNADPVDKIDKSEALMYTYSFREVQIALDLNEFNDLGKYKLPKGAPTDKPLPFTLVIDWNGRNLASLTEGWRADDINFKRKVNITKAGYFPSFDFWDYGFAHLVAPQAKSATNHLRLIANAATYASMPTLLTDTPFKNTQNNMLLEPGTIKSIQVAMPGNLASSVMPLPFKEPSPHLDALRQYFDEGASQAILALNDIGEIGSNTPVATMLQILDRASIVPNFLMRQIYEALSKEYKIILEHLKDYADFIDPQFMPYEFKVLLNEFDFNSIQIVPTANPDISSQYADMYKYDAILGLVDRYPDKFNTQVVLAKYLQTMGIKDHEDMLNSTPEVQSLPPLLENAKVRSGQEIKVFKFQDHQAHNIVHQNEIDLTANDPNLEPAEKTRRIVVLTSHMDEHTVYNDLKELEKIDDQDLGDLDDLDENLENMLAMMEAAKILEKKEQDEATAAQQPPVPTEMDILQREVAVNEQRVQLEAAKMEHQNQIELLKAQKDMHIAELKAQSDKEIAHLKAEIEMQRAGMTKEVDVQRMHMEMQKFMTDVQMKMEQSENNLKAKLMGGNGIILPPT